MTNQSRESGVADPQHKPGCLYSQAYGTSCTCGSRYLYACVNCKRCIETNFEIHINQRPICVACNAEMAPVNSVPWTGVADRPGAQDEREMRTYEQGRLDQFLRMKKERPIDPCYWDMHEENGLRDAAGRASVVQPSPLWPELLTLIHSLWGKWHDGESYSQAIKDEWGKLLNRAQRIQDALV